MANWFNFLSRRNNIKVSRDGNQYFYEEYNSKTNFNTYINETDKINMVLSNPAALFIFTLQCDLASLGKFYVYKDEEIIEEDPILDLLNRPNPLQTGKQFVWDYMFWNMLGNVNLYVDSKLIENNKLYFLKKDLIEYPNDFKKDRIILSNTTFNKLQDTVLTYKQHENSFKFKYKQLIQLFDLSNGLGDYFESPSRLDALYKIVTNSDLSLNSKNINAEFMSKFFVSGKVDVKDTSQMPMGDSDKQSIRESMRSTENVYPTKTMIDVKRFIDNYGVLKSLDEAFLSDYYLIGKAFGIPRDVLEAYNSSTYENQEKARASHISYTLQPKMNDLCNALENYFGYDKLGKEICIDYSHLPHVQVFEKEKAEARRLNAMALKDLIDSGANPEQAAEYLELELEMTGERNLNTNSNGTGQQNQQV